MTETDAGTAPSAGALLRAARERQGLHIAALAAAIKVAPRKLDALENDRWHELPDATFTRALAQTICRTLKIEPKPVLDLLPPAETMGVEPASSTLNEPFRAHDGPEEGGWVAAAIRPLVLAALLLLLAAMAIYLVPASWWSGQRSMPSPAVTDLPKAQRGSDAAVADATSAAPVAGAAASAAGVSTAEAPRGETVFAAPGGAAVPQAASASAPAATAAEPMAAAPSGALQLRVSEASWIEVRDAGGRLLLSRTVQPGEAVGLDGSTPLRLVIGNAPATTLSFRGRTIDLVPHTRDTVARLDLQ